MKTIKLVICTLLAVSFSLFGIFGNTRQSESVTKPIEISFMHCHGGASGELVSTFCKEFSQQSGGKYLATAFFVDGLYEGLLERLQMLSLSDSLPEIAQAGHHYANFMTDNFPVVPLQTFIDKTGYDTSDFFPGMLDLGRDSSGQIVAFPFGVSTPVLYYNKEMLEANGLTTPPKTFDEVRDYAKKLTNKEHYGIYINFEQPGLWMIQSIIENYGEQMLAPDRKSVGFDRAGLKTFEFLNNLVNVDKSMPLPDGTEQGVIRAQEMFNAGKIAMYITTTGRLGSLQRDAQNTVLTTRFPSEDGKFLSVPGGGNSLYILTHDPEKQEAAWELIKYVSAPEQANRVAQLFGYMVVSQKAFNTPELMGNYLDGNPAARVTYEQVPYMTKWCSFPGSSGTKYVRVTLDNISAMFQKEKTPEQAFRDTVEQMNEIIRTGM